MTQALAAYDEHGLILATDSRATRFLPGGGQEYFSVPKLYPLGRFAAILSGGAGVSVPLTQALRHEIGRRRGLDDLEHMVEFALGFLSQGYSRYLERHGPEPEGFRRLYFILGGYSPQYAPPGFRLYLLGSEENELPLRLLPVTNLVVMPRNLGMELRLLKALAANSPLSQLLSLSKEFLEKQAAAKEEVGPPFYFATITPAGYHAVELKDPPPAG
uniref:20S proteasome subunit A/B n=1 Tax=Desulfobacca acetoxidans TaxID=60893 RepID=A0A7C5EKM7_9BACT